MNSEIEFDGVKIDKVDIDRDKIILEFIIEHQGCRNTDILNNLVNSPQRTVLSRHINNLIKEGLILNISGRKNKNELIPNKNNLISFVKELLLKFKRKYLELLEKSLINNQINVVLKEIRPQSTDTSYEIHMGEIYGKLYSDFKRSMEIYDKITKLSKETNKIFEDSLTINSQSNQQTFEYRDKEELKQTPYHSLKNRIDIINSSNNNLNIKKYDKKISNTDLTIEKQNELMISKVDEIRQLQKEYVDCLYNSGYLVLTSWPVFLYFILSHILNLKSILIWPNKIMNMRLLFELNEFVIKDIAEIKNGLLDFLSRSKNERIKSEMKLFMKDINPVVKKQYFLKIYQDYSILNLRSEIRDVLDILIMLDENEEDEIKDIRYIEDVERKNLDLIYNYSKNVLDYVRKKP